MDFCTCADIWPADEPLLSLQRTLDLLAAMACFAVSLNVPYFLWVSPTFPHKWVFVYFGIVAIICGTNHMTNLWKYSQFSINVAKMIVIVKVCTTIIIWLTVVVMKDFVPSILSTRKREQFHKNRVEELSRQRKFFLHQEETRKSFIKLTNEVRSTLNRHYIIQSTVVGLGRILDLEECTFWFPSQTNETLQLSYTFNHSIPVGTAVQMSLPVVAEIFDSVKTLRIPDTCALVRSSATMISEVVAIRIPLKKYSSSKFHNWYDISAMSYAVIVLVLPSDSIRMFQDDELELVGALAEQVSIALAHASAVEESTIACDYLSKQNSSVESALQYLEMTSNASNALWTGIVHDMLTPVHAIPILSSILLETMLTIEQRVLAEVVLKSSRTLQTLVRNESDLSRLENGRLEPKTSVFNLSATIKQVIGDIKTVATVKKLSLSLILAPNLPVYAIADQEWLKQIILNIVGNGVKFTKEGHISVTVSVAKPKSLKYLQPCKFHMVSSKNHVYMLVQVEDSGCGIEPEEIPKLFNRFITRQSESTSNQSSSCGVGLAICERLLYLMDGCIWVESEGLGKGTKVTFIVKLGKTQMKPDGGALGG